MTDYEDADEVNTQLDKMYGCSHTTFHLAVLVRAILLRDRVQVTPDSSLCRGYNIGIRIVDEFFAKSTVDRCRSFKETADIIGKVRACVVDSVRGLLQSL